MSVGAMKVMPFVGSRPRRGARAPSCSPTDFERLSSELEAWQNGVIARPIATLAEATESVWMEMSSACWWLGGRRGRAGSCTVPMDPSACMLLQRGL